MKVAVLQLLNNFQSNKMLFQPPTPHTHTSPIPQEIQFIIMKAIVWIEDKSALLQWDRLIISQNLLINIYYIIIVVLFRAGFLLLLLLCDPSRGISSVVNVTLRHAFSPEASGWISLCGLSWCAIMFYSALSEKKGTLAPSCFYQTHLNTSCQNNFGFHISYPNLSLSIIKDPPTFSKYRFHMHSKAARHTSILSVFFFFFCLSRRGNVYT